MGQRPPLPTGCPGVDPLAGGVPCGTALRSAVPNARHQMPFAAATTSPNEERLLQTDEGKDLLPILIYYCIRGR